MDTITRAEMEQQAADDLRWLVDNDPNGAAAWAAVLEDSTPTTDVWHYDLGNDAVYVMLNPPFALATYGQTEPHVITSEWEPPTGLRILEDGAGGLWLYGTTEDGTPVYYGDMAYGDNAVTDLIAAYHKGLASWEHGQDNDQPVCNAPVAQTIAEYDGETLTLHVQRMGAAGRRYSLGSAATHATR